MKTHYLIACASQKLTEAAPAGSIYVSQLFRLSLGFAQRNRPDAIHILSARHGLLGLDQVIEPYEETLNGKSTADLQAWADRVRDQMPAAGCDPQRDYFVFLAGRNYRRFLQPHLARCDVPMQGLGIGRQLSFLVRSRDSASMRTG